MTTDTIVKEIRKLPLTDRLLVVEKTLKAIRQSKERELEHAVSALYNDYKSDEELTIFTQLDTERFYETR